MSMDSCSCSCFSVPEELLIEILVCLPVKTLLRFKSVSKSWLAIIDSSEFINRHMLLITTTTDNKSSDLGPFIFQSNRWDNNMGISSNFLSISGDHEFQVYEDLGIPPCYSKPISTKLCMVGSCNGVICLYDEQLMDVSLWNPAIHQFRPLPKSSSSLTFGEIDLVNGGDSDEIDDDVDRDRDRDRDFIGFGFDLETKDYKVVLAVADRVEVYSLSTDSWRTLEEDVVVPDCLMTYQFSNNGGYLNGSYYGLGSGRRECDATMQVFSFDFTKEMFKFWEFSYTDYTDNHGIILLGGKVIMIHGHRNVYEFFVLNETSGAAKESWTRLYKIGPIENFDRKMMPVGFIPFHKKMRAMGISNDGEYVFMVTSSDEQELWLLNSSTQVKKELQWDRGNQIQRAFVYRCTLVPVSSTRNGSTTYI